MERLDTLGMWDATMAFPEQVEQAAAQDLDFSRLPSHDEIENVVVLGIGGSGIVGDVMLSVAGPFMATPVVVCKSYEPPSFAGPTTLCVAVSYSGDTEETIEAAQTAALAGARRWWWSPVAVSCCSSAKHGTPRSSGCPAASPCLVPLSVRWPFRPCSCSNTWVCSRGARLGRSRGRAVAPAT